MTHRSRFRLVVSSFALAAAVCGAGLAVTPPFRTSFAADPSGLPPGVGGFGQPTAMNVPAGASITVVDDLFGLVPKVADLDSPDGDATWLSWSFSPSVEEPGISLRFSVSFESLYSGIFLDLAGPGGIRVRLRTQDSGELLLSDGCASQSLGFYSPQAPVDVLLLFAPPAGFWAVADPEGDGFDDDVPAEGTTCQPGYVTGLYVYAWGNANVDSHLAFDELVVDWLPLFVDDFESEGTGSWSAAVP